MLQKNVICSCTIRKGKFVKKNPCARRNMQESLIEIARDYSPWYYSWNQLHAFPAMKVSKCNPVEANKKLLTPKQKVGREGHAEVTTFMESIKFKASRYSSPFLCRPQEEHKSSFQTTRSSFHGLYWEGEEAEKRPKEKEERRGTIVGIPWFSPSRHCWKQTKTHWSHSPDFDPLHEFGCYWKYLQKQKSCGRSSEKPFSKGSCLHTWNPYPSTQMGIANTKAELEETNALMDCLLM